MILTSHYHLHAVTTCQDHLVISHRLIPKASALVVRVLQMKATTTLKIHNYIIESEINEISITLDLVMIV